MAGTTDCNPVTVDGSAEPTSRSRATGSDSDLCAEGVWVCDSVNAKMLCTDKHRGRYEGPAGDPTCADGIDNDCNGLTDAADPACSVVVVNTPPSPVIVVTPPGRSGDDRCLPPLAVGSTDREDAAGALTYRWDWENDGTFEDIGSSATHTYATPGVYTVVLEVVDSGGLAAYRTFTVIVSDRRISWP